MAKHASDQAFGYTHTHHDYPRAYQGERMHGDIEQSQRFERREIRYVVEHWPLARELDIYSGGTSQTAWYRIGVGIWEPVS